MRVVFACLVAGVAARASAGVDQSEISATGGDRTRSLLGTGAGVIVGVLDAGIDVNHPALRGSLIRSIDFTGQGRTDDDPNDPGHATGITSVYLGHDSGSGYWGFAPSAKFINARIVTTSDWTTDKIAGNGLFYCVQNGARVLNLSIGNRPADGPTTSKLNLIVDYVTEKYGASVVSAAGNEDTSAVDYSPGGAYNGYSVGALDQNYFRVAGFSNYALNQDHRCKPDIVAPGEAVALAAADWENAYDYVNSSGTSFSAPMVGGALAQMIGYGREHGLSTSPILLKAILLTSAKKGWDNDGTPWAPRNIYQSSSSGLRISEPLDDEQGAGRLDTIAAYHIYSRTQWSGTPVVSWKQGSLGQKQAYWLHLGDLSAGQRVDATLTWFRHVAWRDSNGDGVAGGDDWFGPKGTMADFALQLMRGKKQVVISDSDYDNLEHLSWKLGEDGDYWLRAYRWDGCGLDGKEKFALAARVLDSPPSLSVLRVASTRYLTSTSLKQGVTAVPEPAALAVMALGCILCVRRSRR